MDATHPPPKFKYLKKEEISRLPKNPGVYSFKKGAKLLYIGKAVNIRERVKNHFPSRSEGERRTNVLRTQQPGFRNRLVLHQVKHIAYITTNSEIEALILEANLIKKYQPKYNVAWRDDKNYFYVEITKENFPRVSITHQPVLKSKIFNLKSNSVGPFVDGKALKETLKILRKVFPYRTCKNLPKKPCLWYQLGRCPAPCLLKSDKSSLLLSTILSAQMKKAMKETCQQNAKNLMKILQGKKVQVLKDLNQEMKKAAVTQEFEKAAKIRDQIGALEKVLAHSKIFQWTGNGFAVIKPWQNYHEWRNVIKGLKKILKTKEKVSRIEAYDVSNIQGKEATGAMVAFIRGLPDKNSYRRFKIKIQGKSNDVAMIKEVLSRRLKHTEWPYPDLVLIDGGIGQLNVALKIKNQKSPKQSLRDATGQVKIKNKIKVISLAKKGNKLYLEGRKKPILLKNLPRGISNLILQLRDEAHRFAIAYHHKLRTDFLIPK